MHVKYLMISEFKCCKMKQELTLSSLVVHLLYVFVFLLKFDNTVC